MNIKKRYESRRDGQTGHRGLNFRIEFTMWTNYMCPLREMDPNWFEPECGYHTYSRKDYKVHLRMHSA